MPCSEASEAVGGIANSPSKRLRTETDPVPVKSILKFAKLSENATVPTKGSVRAAGYDLYSSAVFALFYSAYDYSIAPLDKVIVKTDIQIAVPAGCYGRVVKKGDRVAQLICEKICYPELEQLDTLDETVRGDGGFGSTGRN
ncbi:hypothetical protein JZ751_029894 [Albula glossodonta]|uniref:dUTP diphosphatase n=1 Tax=Albula glossodonta TaxID=121402 RepID=A0A8T2N9L5_9TELE|nr:hypothetical protein JZ751_029894 [Albula glossodonta]